MWKLLFQRLTLFLFYWILKARPAANKIIKSWIIQLEHLKLSSLIRFLRGCVSIRKSGGRCEADPGWNGGIYEELTSWLHRDKTNNSSGCVEIRLTRNHYRWFSSFTPTKDYLSFCGNFVFWPIHRIPWKIALNFNDLFTVVSSWISRIRKIEVLRERSLNFKF